MSTHVYIPFLEKGVQVLHALYPSQCEKEVDITIKKNKNFGVPQRSYTNKNDGTSLVMVTIDESFERLVKNIFTYHKNNRLLSFIERIEKLLEI